MRKGIESLEVYTLAMEIGEIVWIMVIQWDSFSKNTVGNNLVRAADSIAYNISEGYARHYFKESRNFCWIARGSLAETKTGLDKCFNRNLITRDKYDQVLEKINICYPKLNNYILFLEKQIKSQ